MEHINLEITIYIFFYINFCEETEKLIYIFISGREKFGHTNVDASAGVSFILTHSI